MVQLHSVKQVSFIVVYQSFCSLVWHQITQNHLPRNFLFSYAALPVCLASRVKPISRCDFFSSFRY